MKNHKHAWQRLLAMALALIMVLGWVPTGVVAEGAQAELIKLVSAELKLLESATAPEYEVVVTENGVDVTADATIQMKIDDAEAQTTSSIVVEDPEYTAVTAKVAYKGVEFSLSSENFAKGETSTEGYLAVEAPNTANLMVGQLFDAAAHQPKAPVLQYAEATGTWVFTPSEDYSNYIGADDYIEAPAAEAVNIGAYNYKVDGELAKKLALNAVIKPVAYTVSFEGPSGAWFHSAQSVTVKVDTGAVLDKVPSDIPSVMVGNAQTDAWLEDTSAWTQDGTFFTKTVQLNPSAPVVKVVNGDQEPDYSLNFDPVKPVIDNLTSFQKSADVTVVEFDLTIGSSGVDTIQIGDAVFAAKDVALTNGHVRVTVNAALDAGFKVVVTSVAGLSSEENVSDKAPTGMPVAEFVVPAPYATGSDGVKYYKDSVNITVNVSNVVGGIAGGVLETGDGETLPVTWNGNSGVFTLTDKVNGLHVKITDAEGRETTAELADKLVVDTTAPVVELSPLPASGDTTSYSKDNLSYTITVTEAESEFKDAPSVTYTVNGTWKTVDLQPTGNGTFEGTFTVVDGEHLTGVQVQASNILDQTADGSFTANVKIDFSAPNITITSNGVEVDNVDNTQYSDAAVTYDVTITDSDSGLTAASATYTLVGGSVQTIAISNGKGSFTLKDGEHLEKIEVSATNGAGLTATKTVQPSMKVDESAPTIEVEGFLPADSAITWTKSEQSYSVKIAETGAPLAKDTIKVFYKLYDDATEYPVEMKVSADGMTAEGSFKIENGQHLVSISVYGKNVVGNAASKLVKTSVCIDTSAPEISFREPAASSNVTYYATEQEYWVSVTEDIAPLETYTATYTYEEDGKELSASIELTMNDDHHVSGTFTLKHGQHLIKIEAGATNAADANAASASKAYNEKVDTTAPVITLPEMPDTSNVTYYKEAQTYKISVEEKESLLGDLVATYSYTVNGELKSANVNLIKTDDKHTAAGEFTLNHNQHLKGISVTAKNVVVKDGKHLENSASVEANVKIDTTAPAIDVQGWFPTDDTEISYNPDVQKYTVTVTEKESPIDNQRAYYKLAGSDTEIDITLTETESGSGVFIGRFDLEHNQVLKEIHVTSVNAVGLSEPVDILTNVKVDTTAPVITVTGALPAELTYYTTAQDYLITVTENESRIKSTKAFYVTANDNGDETVHPLELEGDATNVSASFTIENDRLIRVYVEVPNVVNLSNPKDIKTEMISDTIHPVIDATVAAVNGEENVKVEGIYTDSETGNIYAKLDPVETNDTNGDVTLTVTYVLTERYPNEEALLADGWELIDGTWTKVQTITVPENTVNNLALSVTAKDMAGNEPEVSNIPVTSENGFAMLLVPEMDNQQNIVNAVYTGTLYIDRRTAGNGDDVNVPAITLNPLANASYTAMNGEDLYDDDFVFQLLNVHDKDTNGLGSGIAKVEWMLEETGFLATNASPETPTENSNYDIEINQTGDGENNSVQLTVILTDYVGNVFTLVETFAFDNMAPRINVTYTDSGSCKNDNYFNAKRVAQITYEDLNLFAAQYTKDEQEVKVQEFTMNANGLMTASKTVDYDEDGYHTLATFAQDTAQHETSDFESSSIAPEEFYVDTTRPVISVSLDDSGVSKMQVNGKTEYYNNEVSYIISASDAYMDASCDDVEAWVVYTKELTDGTVLKDQKLNLLDAENRTVKITLTDGDLLTDLQVYAMDNTGWTTDVEVDNSDLEFKAETNEAGELTNSGVYVYAKKTAVDMTPAKVTLTKEGSFVQTVGAADYFDNVVTYTLTITDRFAPLSVGKMELGVDVDGKTSHPQITFSEDNNAYSASFKVELGQALSDIRILVTDNAGNATTEIDCGEDTLTSFEYAKGRNRYTGNKVVVDNVAPTASLQFSENVKSVYTNKNTVYAVLNPAATGESGFLAGLRPVTVTMKVTVKDKNIALNDVSVKTNEGNGKWSGKPKVNADSTLTYTQSITVRSDSTGVFAFDLSVVDLSGNALEKLDFTPINDTIVDLTVRNGRFGSNISVDRRRPSTQTNDQEAPVIEVRPSLDPTVSSNEKELFNGEFNFAMTITDGKAGSQNSGLKTVDWVIDDPVGFVVHSEVENAQRAGTYTKRFNIPVTISGVGESNSVILTITAVDNVGNTTTYKKEFAVDNQAPRIVVNYDNNAVQNERYFKANRVATIQVTDINFNPDTTEITTQVTPSAWVQNGDVWTATSAYTVDDEYTFAIRSVDLANNTTEDTAVDYDGEAAPRDFVIDKTAPVISVDYTPAEPVRQDNQDVNYYDREVEVVVTIHETNFRASDVQAQFNSDNALSAFTGSSSYYSASETFEEGNEYAFSVAYTDLAGNEATAYQSETFSVDLTAPTIEITEGDMTQDELNFVQDNLVLGFTVSDEQSNLMPLTVKVTQLNNAFQAVPVEGDAYYTINSSDERTEVSIDFANIAKDKANDGIYTVEITAQDYSGNEVSLTPELVFSLNRFGSSFVTDDSFTQEFLKPGNDGVVYQSTVDGKLVIKEINPTRVWQDAEQTEEGSVLAVIVNGNTTMLVKDQDYTMTVSEQGAANSPWYVYTYEINPSIFGGDSIVDGRYAVLIYSEDEAGNKNTNESNEFGNIQLGLDGNYSGKIEFTLDTTAPIISTTGVETGGSYDTENQQMRIFLSDNTPTSIAVRLNGQAVELVEAAGANSEAWLYLDEANDCYVLNVPEQNVLFGRQSAEIEVTDAAGNTAKAEVTDFTVSTNAFVRFVVSIWFWIVLVVLAAAVVVVILVMKKRKGQKKAA